MDAAKYGICWKKSTSEFEDASLATPQRYKPETCFYVYSFPVLRTLMILNWCKNLLINGDWADSNIEYLHPQPRPHGHMSLLFSSGETYGRGDEVATSRGA